MLFQVFIIGVVFSFLGSIPPGTLNLAVLQLGMEHKIKTALRFSLAVAIIEYPYAWIAVVFEDWITSSPIVVDNFQLITAVVMIAIGAFSIWSARKPSEFSVRFNESGFRRGLILSVLNPMAIPFWVAYTAFLKSQGWIDLSTSWFVHSYVFGTSVGVMILLVLFTFLAQKLSSYVKDNRFVKLIPGVTLLVLGLYAFGKYIF
ncbi:MAG: LysE family transporter [Cyclobacteriaceae bacterium]|nr:LysE family transporter [Cyclobacteriaceae bacterium]